MSLLQTTSTPSTTTDYAKLYISPPQGGNDANTKLLLHMNTADRNQYFVDSSSGAKTISISDNVQGDDSQYKFGYLSALFDGTDDYLDAPDSADWYFGTGDFTVDTWVRFNALPSNGTYQGIWSQLVDANNGYDFLVYNNGGTYQWKFYHETGASVTVNLTKNSPGLSAGTWYHITLVRSGDNWYFFQDGTQCGVTEVNSSSIADFAGLFYIGVAREDNSTNRWFNGWLDEFRVSKSTARWTADFTPPTRPYGEEGILYVKDSAGTVESLRQNLWVSDGTNMAFSQGKIFVGIGVEQNPGYTYRMVVAGDASLGGIFASSNSSYYAVYGYQYSSSAPAIYGYNAGSNYGVYGYSASSIGVYGSSGGNSAVRGYINSNLYGELGASPSSAGVVGYAPNYTYGVYGYGTTYGIYGKAAGSGGDGIYGYNPTGNGYGVYGVSTGHVTPYTASYIGVRGDGIYGGGFVGSSGGFGVYSDDNLGHYAYLGFNSYGAYSSTYGYFDIAETYSKEPGYDSDKADVLSISPDTNMTLRKSSIPYDPAIAGVYSTRPALLIGDTDNGQDGIGIGGSGDINMKNDSVPLALAGRVAVKVNNENGVIHRGDYLTSSSTAGVAMKATRPGNCLGIAMEDFNGTNGQITVFISLGYHDPYIDDDRIITALELTSSPGKDLTITPGSGKAIIEGDLIVNDITLTGKLDVVDSATFNSNIIVKGNVTFSSDTVGEAKIKAGDTAVQVSFDKEYEGQPNVMLTATGENILTSNFKRTVADINTKGFKIKINTPQPEDILFNWQAFGADSGKISVSDGTTIPIEIVKP